jgi:hypothetical protein
MCNNQDLDMKAMCAAYSKGVMEGFIVAEINQRRRTICPPKSYVAADLTVAMNDLYAEQPEARVSEDGLVLYRALECKWPCPTKRSLPLKKR